MSRCSKGKPPLDDPRQRDEAEPFQDRPACFARIDPEEAAPAAPGFLRAGVDERAIDAAPATLWDRAAAPQSGKRAPRGKLRPGTRHRLLAHVCHMEAHGRVGEARCQLFHACRVPRLITAECDPGGIEEIGEPAQVRYAADFNARERRSVRPRFPAQVAREVEDHQRLGFIRFKAGRGEARSQIWRKIVTVDLPLNGAVFARDGPARGPGVPIAGIGLEREPTKKRHLLGNGGVCRIGR